MSEATQLFTSNSLSARVAAEVRGHASKRGLRQKDLAQLLKLSPGQISGRFTGRIPFKLDELDTLARTWGIDATELLPVMRSAGVTAGVTPADESGRESTELDSELPRLDLNQQPCDYIPSLVERRMGKRFIATLPGRTGHEDRPIAPVVPLRPDEVTVTKRPKKSSGVEEFGISGCVAQVV